MININKGLKEFNSDSYLITALVEGWIEASIKYLRKAPEDLPYLYNERADVSLLCAGAWMKGFVAIEEYISLKDDKLGRPDNAVLAFFSPARVGEGIAAAVRAALLSRTLGAERWPITDD
jgi:hypothetical protein